MGLFAWCGAGTFVFLWSFAAGAQGATGTFPPAPSAPPPSAPAPAPAAPPPSAPQVAPSAPLQSPPMPLDAAPTIAAASAPSTPPPAQYPYPPPAAYGYYYPVLSRPARRFADDAAVRSSPFIDATMASVSWQNRFSQFLNLGGEAGMYFGGRVRVAVSALFPVTQLRDNYASSGGDYELVPAKDVSVIFGGTVGYVVDTTASFVFAPGVAFNHTNVANYGSVLAFSLPFEWVTDAGLRIGLEFQGGRAFGGVYREACLNVPSGPDCPQGAQIDHDRPEGTTISIAFALGFGFNHPSPQADPRVR